MKLLRDEGKLIIHRNIRILLKEISAITCRISAITCRISAITHRNITILGAGSLSCYSHRMMQRGPNDTFTCSMFHYRRGFISLEDLNILH